MPKPWTIRTPYVLAFAENAGNREATGNYSDAGLGLTYFDLGPSNGAVWELSEFLVYIQDTGNFSVTGYGAASALTNGVNIQLWTDGALAATFNGGRPIQTNADWGRYSNDFEYSSWGQGDNVLIAKWSGIKVRLHAEDSDMIRVALNDDCSVLTSHTFLMKGIYLQPDGEFHTT